MTVLFTLNTPAAHPSYPTSDGRPPGVAESSAGDEGTPSFTAAAISLH